MAENREEVLSQLYALRGSISYMSGNIGLLLRKEAEQIPVTREKEKNYYLLKDGYYNGEMSQEFKIDYDDALRRSNSADERMERAKRYYANRYITEHTEENLAVYIKRKKIGLAISIAILLIGILLVVLYSTVFEILPLVIIGPIMILVGVLLTLLKCSQIKNEKWLTYYEIERIEKHNNEIAEALLNFTSAKGALEKISAEKKITLKKLQPIYTATLKIYADMVDERGWKYLDVVIYYFETKRADSIKEALQLLDRLIQTNMIVSAVQNASKDIQSCIYNATRVLAGAIETACNRICSGLNGIVSSMDMQSALISQSNMTSEQMAEDIQYIKKVFYN